MLIPFFWEKTRKRDAIFWWKNIYIPEGTQLWPPLLAVNLFMQDKSVGRQQRYKTFIHCWPQILFVRNTNLKNWIEMKWYLRFSIKITLGSKNLFKHGCWHFFWQFYACKKFTLGGKTIILSEINLRLRKSTALKAEWAGDRLTVWGSWRRIGDEQQEML